MRTPQNYIDQALKMSGCTSRNKLAALLGITGASLTRIYQGISLPSDKLMQRLATVAGVDPELALIELNIWRSEGDEKVNKAYRCLAAKISNLALILAIIGCAMVSLPSKSFAASPQLNINYDNSIYYHSIKYFIRLYARLRKSLTLFSQNIGSQTITGV